MRDDPTVVALVTRAAGGDQEAWDEVVERYSPLVWSICVRYRLSRQDATTSGRASGCCWSSRSASLREPAALPGWLATTTHRECLRVLTAARKPSGWAPGWTTRCSRGPHDDRARRSSRPSATRRCGPRSPSCPAVPSATVDAGQRPAAFVRGDQRRRWRSRSGSIGPMRARCLERLRRSPHLAGLGGGRDVDRAGR